MLKSFLIKIFFKKILFSNQNLVNLAPDVVAVRRLVNLPPDVAADEQIKRCRSTTLKYYSVNYCIQKSLDLHVYFRGGNSMREIVTALNARILNFERCYQQEDETQEVWHGRRRKKRGVSWQ